MVKKSGKHCGLQGHVFASSKSFTVNRRILRQYLWQDFSLVSVCGNGSILGAESVSLSFRRKRKSSLQAPADSSGYFLLFLTFFLKRIVFCLF